MAYTFKAYNSALLRSACAIVFVLFSFAYLYFFQADLLYMVQHVLSGGTTHYNKTVGALVVTLVLGLLQAGVRRLGGEGGLPCAFSYFPSLALLAGLTSARENFALGHTGGLGLWLALLLVSAYVAVSVFFRFFPLPRLVEGQGDTVAGGLWKNLLAMAVMFVIVCLCGNSNATFHYRLRVESLLEQGEYDKALQVGKKSDDTDPSLTMLRVYALSRSKELGERLFEYPLEGGSSALLPDGAGVRCLFFPESQIFRRLSIRKKGDMSSMGYLLYIERNGLAMKSATDYLLCGYLLDKDLDGFVAAVRGKYDLKSPQLPRHYKEALTLYTHLRANPVLVFHNEVMDADYSDFQNLGRECANERERQALLRDTYGDTYWYYYFYGGRQRVCDRAS